ncbi:MAG TPA: glycoside hydrolase family 31 protein [Chloroflexia bacterium]|nr:glycoside hydrolase family 31 protein [Chloroflexia bacterium]
MTQTLEMLGRLTSFKQEGSRIIFEFENGRLAVAVLRDGLFRIRYGFQGKFMPRRSWAVAQDDSAFPGVNFQLNEQNDSIELVTARNILKVGRAGGGIQFLTADGKTLSQDDPESGPLFAEDGKVSTLKLIEEGDHFYGFGERSSLLEKTGRRYTCWNSDPVDSDLDHGPGADALYQSIPFFMALRPEAGGYGLFFNNTFKSVFDVGHSREQRLGMEAAGGELDYYLIYGPEPAAIVELYTELTGRMPLPPRWSLGYHQCRWSYFPEDKVYEIAKNFRERKIPADVIHLDIDYMHGYRVFTWDAERFPDPQKMTADLGEQGFKLVTIIDPGVKYDPGSDYQVYNEGAEKDYFIHNPDGSLFHGYVWPDDSVFPDYARQEVREWWGDLHKVFVETGIRGIWNDMNEPSISTTPFSQVGHHMDIPDQAPQGSGADRTGHAEIHNIYGLLEDMGTYQGLRRLDPERRYFMLTRAGFAGIQRWSAVWTGDNSAVWEHLEMAMPELSNLGLSGVSFAGTDIGGFFGASSPELWARWIELGAFYPFSRGHSCAGTPQKEPWTWGEDVEDIARKYIEWRYRLLPYIYTLFEESTRTGAPVLRPLLYEFYQDSRTLNMNDQVMLGNALLLAPVYRPGVDYRYVYLPAGRWYDFWSGQPCDGQHLLAHAPLDTLPLYARGGTVLPLAPVMQYSDERPVDLLTLEIYLDEQGAAQGRLYEDDGETFAYERGETCLTTYQVSSAGGQVRVTARREGSFQPAPRAVEIRVHSPAGLKQTRQEQDQGNWEITL